MPSDRGWDLENLFHADPDHPGTVHSRHGGFLEDAGDFDAGFFGISPREAVAMDPQQRLMLEVHLGGVRARRASTPASLRGSPTGVFAGVIHDDYGGRRRRGLEPEGTEAYAYAGTSASVLSGRIAYTLGLEGPAVSVDTACSSSLVATASRRARRCARASARWRWPAGSR